MLMILFKHCYIGLSELISAVFAIQRRLRTRGKLSMMLESTRERSDVAEGLDV